jgi:thymidylate synthase (FAD)
MNLSESQMKEIADERDQQSLTRRNTVSELEDLMFSPIPVLDHGFIRVIDYMGSDSSVVQAARVSYGKGTRRVSDDRNLIKYLLRHSHTTPFEMAEIKLHVKLPLFVARQWIRHRTANVNEYSARYSILDNEFYLPDAAHLAAQSDVNRQGRGETLNEDETNEVLELLRRDANHAYSSYLSLLNQDELGNKLDLKKTGIARELARMNISLNFYTQWYWKVDMHNFMHFLRLRADSHAQYEIRAYADVMLSIFKAWAPWSYEAFLEYRLNSVNLSQTSVEVVRRLIAGEPVSFETSRLSRREWDELALTFNLKKD